jgi:hypothetical protein
MATDEKIEQFRAQVADLRLRPGGQRRDAALVVVGALLMVGGLVAALITYEASLHQSSALNIGSEQILAVSMLALTVIGAALFVFASMARFLRFWMLRQLYEGQAHVDDLVERLSR